MYSIAFDQRLSSWLVFSAVPFSLLPRANRQSVIEKKKPTKMNRKRNYSLDSIRYVLPVFFFWFYNFRSIASSTTPFRPFSNLKKFTQKYFTINMWICLAVLIWKITLKANQLSVFEFANWSHANRIKHEF